MIEELGNDLILETIPTKKYRHEWNSKLLKDKIKEIFNLNLKIEEWFDEEGVDEEEIKKRIFDQIKQKYSEKRSKYTGEILSFAEKRVMLFQLDKDWRDHLAAMDTLRSSVNLRAMGGKDPFYEYKKESFDYFNEMLSSQNEKVLQTLFKLELVSQNNKTGEIKKADTSKVGLRKIGRNDQCPCGSGKKYKQCHGN